MLPPVPAPADDARNPHLGAALAGAAARIAPERIAQVWLFPPRRAAAKESGLAVLVVHDDADDARRTIWTLRYEVESGKGAKTARIDTLEEQGTVPPDRVGRIVDGVVRRLEGEGGAPDIRELDGDADAWARLLEELGADPAVDSGNR